MSDQQPDTEPRTFWFKCGRGHVSESRLPGDGELLLCDAQIVKGPGVILDLCTEELRLHGPSVGEWRAAKAETADAKAQGDARIAHLERLLGEADAALAQCAAQLDTALGNEGDLGHRVDVAREDHRRAADVACAAVHERDVARREAAMEGALLRGLREAVHAEAERLDDRGRHKAANRLREAVTDSYPGGNAPGLCQPVEPYFPLMEAPRGSVRFATPGANRLAAELRAEESLAAELAADPLVSNVEMRRTERGEEEVFYRPKSPEVATIVDGRLVTVLGAPFPEWQRAGHEVMRFGTRGTHGSTIPGAILAMVAEVRELREAERARKRRGPGGFTVVRDVNQQTEAALAKAEAALHDAECDARGAQAVATWAVSALTNVEHDYPEAAAAYRRAVDTESDDWPEPMVYDPALIDALHDLEGRFGGLGVRNALASIEAAR